MGRPALSDLDTEKAMSGSKDWTSNNKLYGAAWVGMVLLLALALWVNQVVRGHVHKGLGASACRAHQLRHYG